MILIWRSLGFNTSRIPLTSTCTKQYRKTVDENALLRQQLELLKQCGRYKDLEDLWNYRLNMTLDQKKIIIPPLGILFNYPLGNLSRLDSDDIIESITSEDIGSFSDNNTADALERVAGVQIVKSNNVPSTNVSAVSGENNTYHGDFSTTAAVVMQKQALGTVKLMDLAVEKTSGDFNIQYQGTLMAAKYAMGHGILRPECAVEIKTA